MEEAIGVTPRKRSKCYTTNIQIAGILTNALIDTGAEITCISEEFLKRHKERFERYPSRPLVGVTVAGAF